MLFNNRFEKKRLPKSRTLHVVAAPASPKDYGSCFKRTMFVSKLKSLFAPVLRCITVKFSSCGRFPHNENVVNEWFDYTYKIVIQKQIKEINVVRERGTQWNDDNASFKKILLNELKLCDDKGFHLFYHGTGHNCAENIIVDGIYLKSGRKKAEFSDGDGFYVTNSLSEGKERADDKSQDNNNPSAVLVFRVSKMELRGHENSKGLDLTGVEKGEEWKNLVKKCFSSDKSFLKTLQYDFIEGPMVDGGRSDCKSNPVPKSGSYQLCVRTNDCALLFTRSVCAVVYF